MSEQPEIRPIIEDRVPYCQRLCQQYSEETGFCSFTDEDEHVCNPAIRRMAARVAELEGVVAKLPQTADGVPVFPGMKLYPLHPIECNANDHGVVTIGLYDPETMEHHVQGYDSFRVGLNYSTREAAEAAQKGQPI